MTTDTTTTTTATETPAPKAEWATLDQYRAILLDRGVPFKAQSGFIRVEGPKGYRLYVASTKTVRRVDLSGFELQSATVRPHKLGKFGNVSQEINLIKGDVDAQLEAFRFVLGRMLELTPKEPAKKEPKAPKAKKEASSSPAPSTEGESAEAKARRLELIKKVAAEKGVAVSANSEAAKS